MVLTEQQVRFILDDIRRNGIELEELQLSLLDHICCIVELEMPADQNFEEFYPTILPRFFRKELSEIQEETYLLLTFKNYYAMKKFMLYSGTFSAISFIFGSLFKVMHWPGASALMFMGVVVISLIFLPLFFFIKAKETELLQQRLILASGTLFGIIISMATLFKVMHWPYANILWLISLSLLFFVFLPLYFFVGIRNPEMRTNTIISSILILVAGGCLFMLTSLKPSRWIDSAYDDAKEHLQYSYALQNELNRKVVPDSTMSEGARLTIIKCDELCKKIEQIKSDLLVHANFDQLKTPSQILQNAGDKLFLTNQFFFDENGESKTFLKEIKKDIAELEQLISKNNPGLNLSLFSVNDQHKYGDEHEIKISWEEARFYNIPVELAFLNLTQIQLDIQLVRNSGI